MLSLTTAPPRDGDFLQKQMSAARDHLGSCRRCNLCKSRTKIVFGAGTPSAAIMVITDKPGYYEDQMGIPLVKTAGAVFKDALHGIGLVPKRDIFC